MSSPVVVGVTGSETTPEKVKKGTLRSSFETKPLASRYASRAREVVALGKELELSGKDLAEFVMRTMAEQERLEREEADRQRQWAEREAKRQLQREKLAQEERLARERLERECADREKERKLRRQKDASDLFPPRVSVDRVRVDNIRIPQFDDTREDLDNFLRKFERTARDQQWPEECWAVRLSSVPKGKALQLYHSVDDGVAADYPQLKTALP